MATSNRPERVGALLRDEIGALLARGAIKDPRVGMATIAEVKVTKDLKIAKVYVQVIGTPKQRGDTVAGLTNAAGYVRAELKRRVSLRVIPQLLFYPDETAEKADKVLGLLADLARKRGDPPEPKKKPVPKKKPATKKTAAAKTATKKKTRAAADDE